MIKFLLRRHCYNFYAYYFVICSINLTKYELFPHFHMEVVEHQADNESELIFLEQSKLFLNPCRMDFEPVLKCYTMLIFGNTGVFKVFYLKNYLWELLNKFLLSKCL